jgi:uncharacterized PurR-regulated membrane protein YhhQ (DUF165 family)
MPRSTPGIVAASLVAYIVSWLIDLEVSAEWEERIGRFKWARVLAGRYLITWGERS